MRAICGLFLVCLSFALGQSNVSVARPIKAEASSARSRVMQYAWQLTEGSGSRLTNSPGFVAAARGVETNLGETFSGLEIKREYFPFGRSWFYSRFSANVLDPPGALQGMPLPWSPSIDGFVSGQVIYAPTRSLPEYFKEWEGRLRGKIVMVNLPRTPEALELPIVLRDEELKRLSAGKAKPLELVKLSPGLVFPRDREARRLFFQRAVPEVYDEDVRRNKAARRDLYRWYKEQGVLALVMTSEGGSLGVIRPPALDCREPADECPPPTAVLSVEHYARLQRLVGNYPKIEMELAIQAQFTEATNSFNLLADLPGQTKPRELVILGAHLDSLGGAGATDNAAGVAVLMEAVRVLTRLALPRDRTVRFVFWGGEEQNKLGSRAYVREHAGEKSVYFNLDEGTGKIRGVAVEENYEAMPIIKAWLSEFQDPATATMIPRSSSVLVSDHTPFWLLGLPAFNLVLDPLDYQHFQHSTHDGYERLREGNLRHNAAVVAWLVYKAANHPVLLPSQSPR